jgi:hypothetical protein
MLFNNIQGMKTVEREHKLYRIFLKLLRKLVNVYSLERPYEDCFEIFFHPQNLGFI